MKVAEAFLGNRMQGLPRATFQGLSRAEVVAIENTLDRARIPEKVDGTWATWHFAKLETGQIDGLLSGVGCALTGSSFPEFATRLREWFRLETV